MAGVNSPVSARPSASSRATNASSSGAYPIDSRMDRATPTCTSSSRTTDSGTVAGACMTTRAPQATHATQASMPMDPTSSTAQGITDSGASCAIPDHASAPPSASWNRSVGARPPASRYAVRAARRAPSWPSGGGYAYVIAPLGHALAQTPAPWQRYGSTSTRSPIERMAPVGQASRQRVHPRMPEAPWAQMFGS